MRNLNLDFRLLAVKRILEADLHVVTEIRAATGLLLPGIATERTAEDGFENIADVVEAASAGATTHSAVLEGGMAITIISGAFLRILQAIIGLTDRLEFRFGFRATRILVRMIAHGKPAVCGLDGLFIRVPLNFQKLVEIGFD